MSFLLVLLTTQLCALYVSALAIPHVSLATNSTFNITKPASSFDSALSIVLLPDVPTSRSQPKHIGVEIDEELAEGKKQTSASKRKIVKKVKSVKAPMGGMQCAVV